MLHRQGHIFLCQVEHVKHNWFCATVLAVMDGIDHFHSTEQADKMLVEDANDDKTHECILKNGRFLFESDNGKLKALYKVQD